jgi:hypothetical protein
MRRKEERWLMILSVMGVFLIITNFSIQYFDSQIQDINKEIILKQGRLNNDALLLINYLQTYYQYSLYESLNTSIKFFNDNMNQWRTEEIKKIFTDYNNSNITDKEAIRRYNEEIYSSIESKANEYENHHFELENITYGNLILYKNLAYGIQTILIVFSVLGYVYLYYNIKKRERENNNDVKGESRRKHK